MSEKTAVSEPITSAIIPFSYDSKEIRTIKDEFGNPWWVAKDICDILGLDHTATTGFAINTTTNSMSNNNFFIFPAFHFFCNRHQP